MPPGRWWTFCRCLSVLIWIRANFAWWGQELKVRNIDKKEQLRVSGMKPSHVFKSFIQLRLIKSSFALYASPVILRVFNGWKELRSVLYRAFVEYQYHVFYRYEFMFTTD